MPAEQTGSIGARVKGWLNNRSETIETASAIEQQAKMSHLSEHLANERTYLAYLRTSIALMNFGIAINRFSLYLEESDRGPNAQRWMSKLVGSEQLGITMVILGMLLLIWAAYDYTEVIRRIEAQDFRPRTRGIYGLTATVLVAATGSVVWLFLR